MKLWKKETEEPGGFDPAPGGGGTAARITPQDVQDKKFRRSSRPSGGYVMREVDEFLDEVTDTLSALIAENEQLRRAAAAAPADRPAASVPASNAADRAAVDAFLQREKGFLQDLGGLVQAHAEELKSMVRSARAAPPPAAVEEPAGVAAAGPASTPAEPTSAPAAGPEESVASPAAVQEEPAAEAPSAPEPQGGAASEADTGVVTEEPIRLEDPEPARTGRADEQDRSLRELFWGEE